MHVEINFHKGSSVALLWQIEKRKCKCKLANKHTQANTHRSKWLSPGFTLHFVFCQSKATEPRPLIWKLKHHVWYGMNKNIHRADVAKILSELYITLTKDEFSYSCIYPFRNRCEALTDPRSIYIARNRLTNISFILVERRKIVQRKNLLLI